MVITYTIKHHKVDETQPKYMQLYEQSVIDLHYKLDSYLLAIKLEPAITEAMKDMPNLYIVC